MPYSAASKRLVQTVAALGSCIAPFMVGSMIVAAPSIGTEFSADVALLGWLTAAFFLTAAAFLIPFGRIADVRGARKVFTVGMGVYLASALLSGLAPDMLVLLLGRALTGVGAAMVFGTSVALLGLVFPPQEQGRAIGINVTAMFVGFSLGLLAGGFLTFYLSWRSVFFIVVALAAINLVLILSRVKGECELSRVKTYDPMGMGLYSSGIVLLFYGLSEVTSALGLGLLVAGLAILGAFLAWESRQAHPLVNRTVARNRDFRTAVMANVAFNCGTFSIPFILSLYLQYASGLDARMAGFLLLVPQTAILVLGPYTGRFMARTSAPLLAAMGIGVGGLGLLPLFGLAAEGSLVIVILSLLLVGIGTALFMPSVLTWAIASSSREDYGVASSLTETTRLAGMTLSNTVLIIIFGMVIGAEPVGTENLVEFIQATRLTVLAYLAFTVIGLMIALWKTINRRMRVAPGGPAAPQR